MADTPNFIVDCNVGKLARWLRLMGYDARFFDGNDDSELVAIAKAEERVILSRDTRIMKRRLITSGRIKAVLIDSDRPERQIHQVVDTLGLDSRFRPFTICLECNQPLVERGKDEVAELVPPYVFKTQNYFMQCPNCQRLYWRGTHWQSMTKKLESLRGEGAGGKGEV
ncbi:MAG: Mut7-C RNAse domain-containing protein [Deltaproteobacteria bacterium]|nr:Mut7-C RNAse domain-containing protein [Deltaproteobacteria bacterium]